MSDSAISGYHLHQQLGHGTCGEVFLATDESGQECVFKNFSSLAIDREQLARCHRRMARAEAAGQVHPGIVRTLNYQVDQTPYFCAMERVPPIDGKGNLPNTLYDVGELDELEAWQLIDSLAEAVGELHKQGVIHGSLHPGNIFLTDDPNTKVKVADFGQGLSGDVHHIDIGETAYFAPPEQLENHTETGDGAAESWDVYRFGEIAYWLINGHHTRGVKYVKERAHEIAHSGGRPVPVDIYRFAESVREQPKYKWNRSTRRREFQLRRQIIDSCLAVDAKDRPTDLREVRNEFRRLESQFALENAEIRVIREREKQATKLFIIRSVAVGLAALLSIASVYLVQYLKRHSEAQSRVSELNQVVDYQDKKLVDSERRWIQSQHDLKSSREAASTFFAKMAVHAGGNGVPLDAAAGEGNRNQLEEARGYFLKTIADIPADDPDASLDRSRAWHALAHISLRMDERDEAIRLFTKASDSMEQVRLDQSDNPSVVDDLNERLMDCYVTLAELHQPGPSELVMTNLGKAAEYIRVVRKKRPNDESLANREANIGLQLGQELHLHRRFGEAVNAFARAGEIAGALQAGKVFDQQLSELVSRLQYSAAISLREANRVPESIDAHLASMETLAIVEQDYGLSDLQKVRLADSYTELGEMFSATADIDQQKEVHNEAIRLLTPLLEDTPELIPGVICLSKNYAHVGRLESQAKRWSDGYRLSTKAITQMEEVTEQLPEDIVSQLTLAELRGQHAELLRYQQAAARACLDKGFAIAESVREKVANRDGIPEPMQRTYNVRLAKIYESYGAVSKAIGDTSQSETFYGKAAEALELALRDGDPVAEWMKERLEASGSGVGDQVKRDDA